MTDINKEAVEHKIHTVKKVAYSSVVGQSIMLLNKAGACIGQLSVIGAEDPQSLADEVVNVFDAPNRHGYKVGVEVGKASQAARIAELEARQVTVQEAAKVLLQPKDAEDREAIYDACEKNTKVYKFNAVLRALSETGE